MKYGLQKKLYEKYPIIFSQKDLPMMETAMCWGIECGDGWFFIIDSLCSEIQDSCDNNRAPQVQAVQVKEKYGSLRFYLDRHIECFENYIDMAEAISKRVCEQCGSFAQIDDELIGYGSARDYCENCNK